MQYHLDMRPLEGYHNVFCDIHIFSATTTTAEALHFSIQELAIVECSGHVQIKTLRCFFVQTKFCVALSCENKILRVFCGTTCVIIFFWSSVSATKISMKVFRIET